MRTEPGSDGVVRRGEHSRAILAAVIAAIAGMKDERAYVSVKWSLQAPARMQIASAGVPAKDPRWNRIGTPPQSVLALPRRALRICKHRIVRELRAMPCEA